MICLLARRNFGYVLSPAQGVGHVVIIPARVWHRMGGLRLKNGEGPWRVNVKVLAIRRPTPRRPALID